MFFNTVEYFQVAAINAVTRLGLAHSEYGTVWRVALPLDVARMHLLLYCTFGYEQKAFSFRTLLFGRCLLTV